MKTCHIIARGEFWDVKRPECKRASKVFMHEHWWYAFDWAQSRFDKIILHNRNGSVLNVFKW